ncbi:MAG: UvrD-helicase domain-containing protein [Candidatus Phytoplasma pruni]
MVRNIKSTTKKSCYLYRRSSLCYRWGGGGTGKTKTLTSRIAYLIQHLNISYDKFLAITFTNNAAKEMKNRVQNT